ncbi:uncharacterized protein ACLA_006580 [Aspergillus clavatus NRRL 1]|uniref:Uncharacterized protein n=1 Tax=Aspergillus clavatus (strain ATCC 1007 / CBS 513.65 / DSM 816 / NCTC 3887 / NRRL 1 / QM 1276 / 107) TaxID=344612 RepID=A1CDH4_ASPCL|nr:uncharacterized protein ACLA_006580 [Aspergillus clavatus NRRL 1]EAW11901.1 hypothetical protein ACLA_006580 [Aspergillus clavatus NRRL 1]
MQFMVATHIFFGGIRSGTCTSPSKLEHTPQKTLGAFAYSSGNSDMSGADYGSLYLLPLLHAIKMYSGQPTFYSPESLL